MARERQAATGDFRGFPRETLHFLQGIERNNNRAWFEQHRDDYQKNLLEPAQDFVVALGSLLRRLSPDVHAEPKINASIRRMNRDIRFSRDKRPYKDHLDLWFWQGEDPSAEHPGYFFRLTAKSLLLGAGMHMFEKPVLERYRRDVLDPKRGGRLRQAVQRVLAAGAYELGGQYLKRPPRGVDPDHPRASLLLHNGLYVGITIRPVPSQIRTPEFPAFCVPRFRAMSPIVAWLVDLVSGTQSSWFR